MSETDPKRVAFFRAFLRSGGVVSLDAWGRLGQTDLACLIEAGATVAAERAGLVADALARRLREDPPAVDPLEQAARTAIAGGRP